MRLSHGAIFIQNGRRISIRKCTRHEITALPGHVVEMMDADALEPVDDLIDDIGRNKFSKTALSEGEKRWNLLFITIVFSCAGYVV